MKFLKSIFTLLVVMCWAVGLSAQSYGILVNGTTYFAGTKVDEYDGYTQYLAHVQLAVGDKFVLCNKSNGDTWTVTLDEYTHTSCPNTFSLAAGSYTCAVAGCYDCYIKLRFG